MSVVVACMTMGTWEAQDDLFRSVRELCDAGRAKRVPVARFEPVLDVAKKANRVGKKRLVDSTALYDAVATQDTVTLVRSAIVAVLRVVDEATAKALRERLKRDDPYDSPASPAVCGTTPRLATSWSMRLRVTP